MAKGRVLTAAAALLVLTVAQIHADLLVEYVEGYVDVRDGSEWYELFIGDTLADDATIKLAESSVAKLRADGGAEITLTRKGIYPVSNLVSSTEERTSSGLSSVLGGRLKTLLGDQGARTQSAVMGVRGAKATEDVEWMAGETAELLKTGRTRLSEEQYEEALSLFQEAYDFAEIDEESEVLFYIGYTNALMSNLPQALDALDAVAPDPEADFYPDLLVLKGQLLTETFAYQDAVDWLSSYDTAAVTDPGIQQVLLLLKGINLQGLERTSEARTALNAAISVDGSTDAATAARKLLQGL